MHRLRAGDGDALAALYDRHAPAVHGLARAVLRDDRLAEEVTHDVFLGLWHHPQAFDPARGSFPGWLLRVARNRSIDLLRRRREQPFPATDVTAGVAWLVDPDPDPADQVAASLVREDVRAALTHLAPDHRRLLELAYFAGLSQREIADRLNRPLGTVKSQIRAAMHRLAELLPDHAPSASSARSVAAVPGADPAARRWTSTDAPPMPSPRSAEAAERLPAAGEP